MDRMTTIFLQLLNTLRRIVERTWARWAPTVRDSRGDVPGWVMITLVNRV